MKNIFIYYVAISVPLAAIIIWVKLAPHPYWFVSALFVYCFLYRPVTDGWRLYKKGLIKKKEIARMFIPFNGIVIDNFRELYLKK